jgi:hypothetical protein
MSKIRMFYKCHECHAEYDEEEILPMANNPSGISQEVCPKCGGAFDFSPRVPQPASGGDASPAQIYAVDVKENYSLLYVSAISGYIGEECKFCHHKFDSFEDIVERDIVRLVNENLPAILVGTLTQVERKEINNMSIKTFGPGATGRRIKVSTSHEATDSTPAVKGVGPANLVVKVNKWKKKNPEHKNLTIKGVVTLWKILGLIDDQGNPKR